MKARWISAVLVAALTAAGCSATNSTPGGSIVPDGSAAAVKGVIPCSQLRTLRELHDRLKVFKNPNTGDSLEYFVVGDGAQSNDVLVMYPGTGQIIPGWPMQLITNSKYSPKIVTTVGYRKDEDGNVSLCHNYRMLFFDYPGVGEAPYRPNLTRDEIANDTDALLEEVHQTLGIDTKLVDPLGWSLGTTMAMKYSFLSPVSRPSRTIHNIVLIATGPGGSLQGQETHDSAECVQKLFNASVSTSGSVLDTITDDLSKLIFPFQGQTSAENGTNSGCDATITASSVSITVTPQCNVFNLCKPYYVGVLQALKTNPWKLTNGVSGDTYDEERAIASDWYLNYCAKAGPHFTSLDCTSYGTVEISKTNGGICKTNTSNPDEPTVSDCDKIKLSGKITVIAGHEDLFDQWTYGQAVVDGYNQSQGKGTARLVLFPGSAGHGIMIQHPRWTQAQVNAAIESRS
jgi:hypothetical protein